MLNLKYFQGTTTTLFGKVLSSPIGIALPAIADVGLVNKVKDPIDN